MITLKAVTPGSDSLTDVKAYISNARALLDTLNHYESLKARTIFLRSDLQASQLEKLGLKLQVIRVKISLDSCSTQNRKLVNGQAKLKASVAENWVWRSVGVLMAIDLVSRVVNAFK